jgi:hypothetical protein
MEARMNGVEKLTLAIGLIAAADPALAGAAAPSPAPAIGVGIGAVALIGIGYRALKSRIRP